MSNHRVENQPLMAESDPSSFPRPGDAEAFLSLCARVAIGRSASPASNPASNRFTDRQHITSSGAALKNLKNIQSRPATKPTTKTEQSEDYQEASQSGISCWTRQHVLSEWGPVYANAARGYRLALSIDGEQMLQVELAGLSYVCHARERTNKRRLDCLAVNPNRSAVFVLRPSA